MVTNTSINTPALFNKGDLLFGQGGGARPAVLPASTNGFVLTLDNTQPTGAKWAAATGGGVTLSPYIVGLTGSDFTTIQAAIDQAASDGASCSNPKNIYIKPGTYFEDPILHDGINLIGFDPAPNTLPMGIGLYAVSNQSVRINGSISYDSSTLNASVEFRIYNIWIVPQTDDAIILSGNPGLDQRFYLGYCRIDVNQSGQGAFNLTNSNLIISDCVITDQGPGGSLLFKLAGDNNFYASRSLINPLDTYSVPDGVSHNIVLRDCTYGSQVVTSGNSAYSFACYHSTHFSTVQNAPYHTIGSTTDGTIIYEHCEITSTPLYNVATINNSDFNTYVSNCYFGRAGNNTSDVFSGGNVQITNSSVQNANGVFERFEAITSGFNGSSRYTSQSGIQTTNNTPQVLASVFLNQSESITLSGTITAAQDDHSNMVGGNFLICARRAVGGNVTLVGSPVINMASSSTALFTCVVNTISQTVQLSITGVLGETYNWVCTYSFQKILTEL